ncbi:prepilin peptidase [Fusobacterium sp. SB021]|uniref:prepilin peptidase n=1 Tax=Fusobacterium sp. SB021 TaxID=2744227 RepID=UPI003CE930AB
MDRNLIEIILDFSFFIILFFISLKDLKEKEIPNFLTLGIIFLGILKIIFLREDFEKNFFGLGVFPVFFLFLYGYAGDFLKKEIIGFGDIKLVSGIGFYFGYSGIYNLIIFHNIIFILGFLFLIPIFFLKKIKKEEEVPFAPCICLGAVIYKFFVERI